MYTITVPIHSVAHKTPQKTIFFCRSQYRWSIFAFQHQDDTHRPTRPATVNGAWPTNRYLGPLVGLRFWEGPHFSALCRTSLSIRLSIVPVWPGRPDIAHVFTLKSMGQIVPPMNSVFEAYKGQCVENVTQSVYLQCISGTESLWQVQASRRNRSEVTSQWEGMYGENVRQTNIFYALFKSSIEFYEVDSFGWICGFFFPEK